MTLRNALAITIAMAGTAGAVLAQPADTYVSGLLHQPIGDAQFGPVDGRRLPVHNLGSSGEDGVEVNCRSAWGGAVGVDLTGFAGVGTPNREIRIRPKGWDGTVKGTMRAYNAPATGQTMLAAAFGDLGAIESSYTEYDELGAVVASGVLPPDGLAMPPCPNPYQIWYIQVTLISYGPPRQWAFTWHYFCSDCPDPWGWWLPGGCGGVSTARTIVVTPDLPPGALGLGDLDTLLVTGRDLPDLDGDGAPDLVVGNADLKSFSPPCPPWNCLGPGTGLDNARWGLGQAHISEQCTPDGMGGCDENVRRLVVDNLGSSGADGVAVSMPHDNGGVSVSLAKGNCCRGHVIIMKLYDDEGQELRVSRTQTTDPNDVEVLDADFSALGTTGFRLTLFGPSGTVLGPPEGTAIYGGGPRPQFTGHCPPGSREIWVNQGTPANPVWVFSGCDGLYDFVVPGVGTVTGVASFQVGPLDATSSFGQRVLCEIASDDDQGLVIEDVAVTPAPVVCAGDSNCDGVITWRDIDFFVAAMTSSAAWEPMFAPVTPSCPYDNNDVNGDGIVSWRDIDPFVALMNTACP